MMPSRIGWTALTLLSYAAAMFALYGVEIWSELGTAKWRIAHGILYAGVGALLLGALARLLPHAGAHLWRALAVIGGAAAAGFGLWVTQSALRTPATLDAWMAALLGLALTAMVPRWLPIAWTRRWFGIERRQTARD